MCGIAGVAGVSLNGADLSRAATAMSLALHHRGPNARGVYVAPSQACALAATRLSVLDLSHAADQPMQSRDGTQCIAYNGEVYNYRELAATLPDRDALRSTGDTEVVLRLFERFGPACLTRMRGMFAFAVWDERKRELFLARDRFGIKPLYYAWNGTRLVFASEIKALAQSGLLQLTIDQDAIEAYFAFGSIPSPLTIYAEIRALEPAHALRLRDGRLVKERYWTLPYPSSSAPKSREIVLGEIGSRLRRAVSEQLVSDVPVGVFLSGGVDSSALVALMREVGHRQIRSFSIAFENPDYNEHVHAASIAKRYETEHVERVIGHDEVRTDLSHIIWSLDQPSIDGVNTYYASKLAREGDVVVALSGLGSDEIFFGYSIFRVVRRLRWLAAIARLVPGGSQLVAETIRRWRPHHQDKVRLLLQGGGVATAHVAVRGLFLADDLKALIGTSATGFDPCEYEQSLLGDRYRSTLDDVHVLEMGGYMANQLLRDTDATSMAHSLEVRVPFLDNQLVDYLSTVPADDKLGPSAKPLLVGALDGLLPHDIVDRPKQGFVFPFEPWMSGPWRNEFDELFHDKSSAVTSFVDHRRALQLWTDFKQHRVHWSRIWSIAVLGRWLAEGQASTRRTADIERVAVRQ